MYVSISHLRTLEIWKNIKYYLKIFKVKITCKTNNICRTQRKLAKNNECVFIIYLFTFLNCFYRICKLWPAEISSLHFRK